MSGLAEDFAIFWSAYPRRTAKLAALKAYERARRLDSAENILAGVERYRRHLPEEVRFICHPATWLNQGRWMDEDDEPVRVVREHWSDECARLHGGTCAKAWSHHLRMQDERELAS